MEALTRYTPGLLLTKKAESAILEGLTVPPGQWVIIANFGVMLWAESSFNGVPAYGADVPGLSERIGVSGPAHGYHASLRTWVEAPTADGVMTYTIVGATHYVAVNSRVESGLAEGHPVSLIGRARFDEEMTLHRRVENDRSVNSRALVEQVLWLALKAEFTFQ